jgi:hypothetical protein
MGHRRGAYRLWAGRTDGRRPLGKLRNRWEDIIKLYRTKVTFAVTQVKV